MAARTVVVDGISVEVAIDPAHDYEVIECELTLSDRGASTEERNRAYFRRNHILLGDQYDRVMGELREAHDGELDTAVVQTFLARVVAEAVEAKNS